MKSIHRLFYYLILFFLPTQIGKHYWPDWSYVLGRRIDYLSPTLYVTDILIVGLCIAWILEYRSMGKNAWRWISFSLIVFIVLAAKNIGVSVVPMVTFFMWLKVVEFIAFGGYIISTRPSCVRSLIVLSASCVYVVPLTLLQFFQQQSIGSVFWYMGERTFTQSSPGIAKFIYCMPTFVQELGTLLHISYNSCLALLRPYSTFPHPNVLAGFLMVIGIGIVGHGRDIYVPLRSFFPISFSLYRRVLLIFVAIIMTCIFLTMSRASIVLSIAGAFGLVIIMRPYIHLPSHMNFYLIGGCVVSMFVIPLFLSLNVVSESVVLRQVLFDAAVKLFRHSPFFGIGLGAFIPNLPSIMTIQVQSMMQPVHNIYMLALTELGIVGVIIVGLMLIILFRHMRTSVSQGYRGKSFHVTLLMIMVYLLHGSVDHYAVTLQQGQLLLIFLLAHCWVYSTPAGSPRIRDTIVS